MSYGSEKSSSGPSESESSSAGTSSSEESSSSPLGSSSSNDDGPPWPPDDESSSGSSSSGSSSESSEGNPFKVLILDLIWTTDTGIGWRVAFYAAGGGELPGYVLTMPPPGPTTKRFAIRLDLAYEDGHITTQGDIEVFANHYMEDGGASLRVEGTYNFTTYGVDVPVVEYKEGPPAGTSECVITVLADGTFSMH